MNRRFVSPMLSLVAVALAVSGCHATPPTPPSPSHPSQGGPLSPACPGCVGEIDEGGYVIKLVNGTTAGGAWAIYSGSNITEYWVKSPSAWPTKPTTLAFSHAKESTCSEWWKNVCPLSVGSYYTTTVLATPPAPCADGGATIPAEGDAGAPLLPPGDYQLSSGGAFAWIFVDPTGEYWAMQHKLETDGGTATLTATSSFTSYSTFGTFDCKQFPVPSVWYAPQYISGTASCGAKPSWCPS